MKKDIFIDDNIAKNFVNPVDTEYVKLINWLNTFNHNPSRDAYLVVSKKLLEEYNGTHATCKEAQNICVIVAKLQIQGRLTIKKNKELREFRRRHYKKHVCNHLTCSKPDREYHIPTVLLSTRHYALSADKAFINDLSWFPGFTVTVAKRPESINYV